MGRPTARNRSRPRRPESSRSERGLDTDGWQLLQRGPQPRRPLASFYGFVGPFGWSVATRVCRAARLRPAVGRARPPTVDRDVADQTQQPRSCLAARGIVAPGASPDAQERFLDGVGGELRLARDAEARPYARGASWS